MKVIRTICIKLYELVNNCLSPSDDDIQARLIELEERGPNREYPHSAGLNRNIEPGTPGETRSLQLKEKLNELGTSVVKFGAKNKNKRVSDKSLDVLFQHNSKPANMIVDMRNSKPFNKKEERVITEHLKLEKKRSWSTDNVEIGFNSNVDITGAMSEWNERQYIFFKHHFEYSYLSQTMKMKLTRNIFLGLANKKLEKFHSSLSTERISERKSRRPENQQTIEIKDEFQRSLKGEYTNDDLGLKCMYRRKKNSKKAKPKSESEIEVLSFEKLVSFSCNASDPLFILKWFNSEKTWESLFNLVNMRLVENERYSVFQAEQFSPGLIGKRFYTIVRQIEVTKFDNQPGKHFIIQTDISFGKDDTFHNILKFEISKFSKVEIFSTSAEKTKGFHHTVFMEQWRSFEESLVKHNIPKKDQDFMEIEENIIGEEDQEV